ncbi:MAG: hypothetical protein A3E88_04520 [Legionellales bacterium RIFCSPHIGHO2_12_FULL_35_11]|nr:MAG: hypothetical protein A3E88_04520 [Legionellales bacterium RIFCSPHIGHO2_12_FULL_35_11]
MRRSKLARNDRLGQIAWVLPNPGWRTLVLGSRPVIATYNVCNTSNFPVTISMVELVQGNDSRLNIVGGNCTSGKVLCPQEICTIELEANPRAIGTVKQVLSITHAGIESPLWIDIVFAVVRKEGLRRDSSYLVEDTLNMERLRRQIEQNGHRKLAKVNAREHGDEDAKISTMSAEGQLENNIHQNPWLNSQRFDGVDKNLNPDPPLNTKARTEFDNNRREQEMEKQLRLGHAPRVSSAPKPPGM